MINEIHFGDCRDSLKKMATAGVKVQTCVTSPPYFGLRDYGHEGQIGLDKTPAEYVANMVEVFRMVRDVLADDGTLWLNLGDSYGKGKQLMGIPWRVALALQDDGWILRQDIIWHKPNPMPECVTDRCTKAHEYIFLFVKSPKYHYDADPIRTPLSQATLDRNKYAWSGALGRNVPEEKRAARAVESHEQFCNPKGANKRSVWSVAVHGYKGAHFATFPPALVEPCILAGSRPGDIVLDPFMGSGTTAAVAVQHGRQYVGCELNPAYEALQIERIDAAYSKGLL